MKIRNTVVGALLISSTAFGAVYAAAATLPLDGGALQEGTDTSLVCQTDPVHVNSWGVNSSDDAGTGGKVTFVQLDNIDPSCFGNRLMGRVENASGNVVGYTTIIDPGSGAAAMAPIPADITATTAKLQLIEPDGSHGVDASVINSLVLWIEGGSSALS